MTHIELVVTTTDPETLDRLVAWLNDIGYEGFLEEPPGLKAYIPESRFEEAPLEAICQQEGLRYVTHRIEPQNWNLEWERSFTPVTVADRNGIDFVHIHASFHPRPNRYPHALEITPRMSFGTGHHATTSLMVSQMSGLAVRGTSVLDFGTGTGVLAILAEKLGAKTVLAIENDPGSVENAADNMKINGCTHILLQMGEDLSGEENDTDILLANINLNVILEALPDMRRRLRPGGDLLLSGMMASDEPLITQMLQRMGWQLREARTQGGWLLIHAIR